MAERPPMENGEFENLEIWKRTIKFMSLYITFNISCTDYHFFRGNKYAFIIYLLFIFAATEEA